MPMVRVTERMIAEVLGVEGEEPGDETSASTINVHLDMMWREVVQGADNVLHMSTADLAKLSRRGLVWSTEAKVVETRRFEFERGTPIVQLVSRVNEAPDRLADMLVSDRLVWTDSPTFKFTRAKKQFEVWVEVHALFLPERFKEK